MTGAGKRYRRKMTVRMQISESLSHSDCPTMAESQLPWEHHSSSARTWLEER